MWRHSKHRKRKGNPKLRGKPHRKFSKVTGEGINIDRLFVRGMVDVDTYLRYLHEYDIQTRHGNGLVAIGQLRNGRLDYAMTRQKDYFYDRVYDSLSEPSSPQNMELVADFLGDPPDYRTMLLRERSDAPLDDLCNALYGTAGTMESWAIVGGTTDTSLADVPEEPIDGYLRTLEDGGTPP